MYIGLTVENFVTIGIMLLVWMLAIHLAGQAGLQVASWLPGGGG